MGTHIVSRQSFSPLSLLPYFYDQSGINRVPYVYCFRRRVRNICWTQTHSRPDALFHAENSFKNYKPSQHDTKCVPFVLTYIFKKHQALNILIRCTGLILGAAIRWSKFAATVKVR